MRPGVEDAEHEVCNPVHPRVVAQSKILLAAPAAGNRRRHETKLGLLRRDAKAGLEFRVLGEHLDGCSNAVAYLPWCAPRQGNSNTVLRDMYPVLSRVG